MSTASSRRTSTPTAASSSISWYEMTSTLRALGSSNVERHRLGWRFWWGNPFAGQEYAEVRSRLETLDLQAPLDEVARLVAVRLELLREFGDEPERLQLFRVREIAEINSPSPRPRDSWRSCCSPRRSRR